MKCGKKKYAFSVSFPNVATKYTPINAAAVYGVDDHDVLPK